jgi:PAS domain S-box-containing protein
MSESNVSELKAPVLGQLLLMQSMLGALPDEKTIFSFVCRGLLTVPGVTTVQHHSQASSDVDPTAALFPVVAGDAGWGVLVLGLADAEAFKPYDPYLRNFVYMIALILKDRAQSRIGQQHQQELERHVLERTRLLTEENMERRRVEADLRHHRNMLAQTLDSIPQAIFWKDVAGVYQGCNRVFAMQAGLENPEQVVGLTDFDLPWTREDAERYRAWDRKVIEEARPVRRLLEDLQQSDGKRLRIETSKVPLIDAAGCVYGVLGVFEDVTDRYHAEKEREKLQAQLVQAQKIESIGRLAGGVAHDFNNMLQAILGNANLALEHVGVGTLLREHLEEILTAAERSASLTHQLLAFARKQTASPRILDLNTIIPSVLKMLRRLIGEDVELVWAPGKDLWPVKLDPVQVDQLLANIVVNARDAIAGVGRITLATENVTLDAEAGLGAATASPGDYVKLSISDTGTGMSAETLSHLFEPFFTTKPAGAGTGLGLATVFGIVSQNRGGIDVQSAPGKGTVVTLFLPRTEAAWPEPKVAESAARGGAETILLVEDEELILSLAKRILQQQGYTVIPALLPSDALQTAKQSPGAIDLLITDVIMPGMNGRELLHQIEALNPGLRCLFISGYTSDIIASQGVIESGIQFQQKPFTAEQLVRRVRQVLDEPPAK